MPTDSTAAALRLFQLRGASGYGGEAVSQLEHALQAALCAEREGAPPTLVAAVLLHDVGHLLHDLPDDAPDRGQDDHHENSGAAWLAARFAPAVAEPVRLHVAAKRYLCAVEPEYRRGLSGPSEVSLALQGGPMRDDERRAFEAEPFFAEAVRLRRWDEAAKIPHAATPPLEHYVACLNAGSLPAAPPSPDACR